MPSITGTESSAQIYNTSIKCYEGGMVNPDLKHFCIQWFIVQTAAMNAMFRLLGELSHQQTLAIQTKNNELFDRVTKMRDSIVGVVIDETNLTERTKGYNQVFHNQLFKESAERAGVVFPSIDQGLPDTEVKEFIEEVTSIESYLDLFTFLRATEHEAEHIFEKMRMMFETYDAPKEAFAYIEVHEKIESRHNDESTLAQNKFEINDLEVQKYISLWQKVLRHLNLA